MATWGKVNIPLDGGISQKTDQRLLPLGSLATVQNMEHVKLGSLQKRNGMQPLPTGSVILGSVNFGAPPFQQLASYDSELLGVGIDGDDLFSWSPGANLWSRVDRMPPCIPTRTSIVNNGNAMTNVDMCSVNGFNVYAWSALDPVVSQTVYGTYYMVTDSDTGSVIIPQTLAQQNTGTPLLSNVRVVVADPQPSTPGPHRAASVIIMWSSIVMSTYSVWALSLNVTPGIGIPVVQAGPTVISNADLPYWRFDACGGTAGAETFYAAVAGVTGSFDVYALDAIALTQKALAQYVSTGSLFVRALGIAHDPVGSGTVGLVWADSSNVRAAALNGTTLALQSPNTIIAVGSTSNPGLAGLVMHDAVEWTTVWQGAPGPVANTPLGVVQWVTAISGSTLINQFNQSSTWNVSLLSKPWSVQPLCPSTRVTLDQGSTPFGKRAYCLGFYSSSSGNQSTQFVFDLSVCTDINYSGQTYPQIVPVATIIPQLSQFAGVISPTQLIDVSPAQTQPYSTKNPLVFNTLCSQGLTAGSLGVGPQARGGIELLTLDFSPLNAFDTAELQENMNFSAGLPVYYDGLSVGEQGFCYGPDFISASWQNNASVGSMAAGTYYYSAIYEWLDNKNNVHQSAPLFAPIAVTTTGSHGYVLLTTPSLTLTMRQQVATEAVHPVNVVWFRGTAAGATAPLFRLTSTGYSAVTANDMTKEVSTYLDTVNDTQLSSVTLYSEGNAAGYFTQPPSCRFMVQTDQRLWVAGQDDPRAITYSNQAVNEGQPVQWILGNNANTFYVTDGGAITGLGTLDDKLVIFKSDRIFETSVVGQGPDNFGNGSNLSSPVRTPSDVGCTNHRSIVTTPDGIMFQSSIGIHLYTRNNETVYKGAPVVDALAAFGDITSAVIHPTKSQVRFTVGNLNLLAPYSGSVYQSQGLTLVYDYLNDCWTVNAVYDSTYSVTSSMGLAACNWQGNYTVASANMLPSFPTSGDVMVENTSGYVDGLALTGSTFIVSEIESPWVSVSGLQGVQFVSHVSALISIFDRSDVTISVATDYNQAYTQLGTWPASQVALAATQLELHIRDMRSQSFRVKVTDAYAADGSSTTGQSIGVQGLALRANAKPGRSWLNPAGRQ